MQHMQLNGTTIPGIGGPVTLPATTPAASGNWLTTLSNTLQTVLPGVATTVLAAKQTRDLQKINIARAQSGLEPLDIAKYQEASAPVIKVQGGVDSGTSGRLMWGVVGGLGLLGLLLANRQNKKST
jgi:hypothetical protein